MTDEERKALKIYISSDYKKINQGLRGWEELTPRNARVVAILKSLLDNSFLPRDMVLYRGTHRNNLGVLQDEEPEDLIGKIFIEQGFMSTTKTEYIAKINFRGDVLMKIYASKGTRGLDITEINPMEAEVLLSVNQRMKIISAKNRSRRLLLEVIVE